MSPPNSNEADDHPKPLHKSGLSRMEAVIKTSKPVPDCSQGPTPSNICAGTPNVAIPEEIED